MKTNTHFHKYQNKLSFEAFLKSLLVGLSIGFSASFISALVTWFLAFNGLWLSLGILVATTSISTAILYFKAFYPTVMNNARRLDSLGLEERLITMVEYENDQSYIAKTQREDAKRALETIDKRQLKLTISRKIIIPFIILSVFGSAMITLNALSEYGILPSGDELIETIIPDEPEIYLSITYDVEEGGYIDGESDQLVLYGTDATPVIAVPDDGYVFVEWSDGHNKPYRVDLSIVEDLELFAVFELGEEGEGDGDGEGEGDGDGDEGTQGEGQGEGESDQQGDQSNNSNTGGGANAAWNQIIDGDTYYRKDLELYKEEFREYLEQHKDELTPEQIKAIQQYIDIV